MDITLILKLVSALFISGGWLVGVTLLVERIGTKRGGLIANLPSTLLVSLVYIAIVQSPEFAANTAKSVPLGMAISKLFLFTLIVFLRKGLFIALTLSLVVWFFSAIAANFLPEISWLNSIIVYVVISLVTFYLVEKKIGIHSIPKSNKKYTLKQILSRAIFAGSMVTLAIVLSNYLPPYLTGIFATFPAVMLFTMIILIINQSAEFAQATGKVMLISSSNIIVFSAIIAFTYPVLGILMGTIVALLASVIWILILSPFLKRVK